MWRIADQRWGGCQACLVEGNSAMPLQGLSVQALLACPVGKPCCLQSWLLSSLTWSCLAPVPTLLCIHLVQLTTVKSLAGLGNHMWKVIYLCILTNNLNLSFRF